MNHTWIKIKSKDKYTKKHKCTMCGCVKEATTFNTDGFFNTVYIWTRSGMLFQNRPDCINWDEENKKTID